MLHVYISSYIMQYEQKHKSIHMRKLEKNMDCVEHTFYSLYHDLFIMQYLKYITYLTSK